MLSHQKIWSISTEYYILIDSMVAALFLCFRLRRRLGSDGSEDMWQFQQKLLSASCETEVPVDNTNFEDQPSADEDECEECCPGQF